MASALGAGSRLGAVAGVGDWGHRGERSSGSFPDAADPRVEVAVGDRVVERGGVGDEHSGVSVGVEYHTALHGALVVPLDVTVDDEAGLDVVGASVVVDGRVQAAHLGVGVVFHLEDVEFTAAGSPARAVGIVGVSGGPGDTSVQQPDGRHVPVVHGASLDRVFLWHVELEQKHLDVAGVAVVGGDAVSVDAAVVAESRLAAADVGENGVLFLRPDQGVFGQYRGLFGLRESVGAGVRQGLAETGGVLAGLGQERDVSRGFGVGIVVGSSGPQAIGVGAGGEVGGGVHGELVQHKRAAEVHRDFLVDGGVGAGEIGSAGVQLAAALIRVEIFQGRDSEVVAVETQVQELEESGLVGQHGGQECKYQLHGGSSR